LKMVGDLPVQEDILKLILTKRHFYRVQSPTQTHYPSIHLSIILRIMNKVPSHYNNRILGNAGLKSQGQLEADLSNSICSYYCSHWNECRECSNVVNSVADGREEKGRQYPKGQRPKCSILNIHRLWYSGPYSCKPREL
jgi:hypothetical protein